jgi:hypothetical protein
MNRTQAIERVDEILDLFAEMYVSGRCPRCGVPLLEEDRHLPARTSMSRRVAHHAPCELASCTEELARLTRRFAIRLEPVLLDMSGVDASILTVRRVPDRRAVSPRDASSTAWSRPPEAAP